ncbi:hypothetical protein [Nocardioides sp. Leaf285]|uniref:hypothetical protein n=1 Tax=Nocardioides sp. Leaf285 TaxID=1736322 RepID=UPI0012EA3EC7|nr:hypothetical protein [Nocardioides sp. Leaf285]
MSDFRSDPMPSPEGKGRARAAWDAYAKGTNRLLGPIINPALEPVVRSYAVNAVSDLLGFWLMWHLEGGFEGLRKHGMSRSAIYRRVGSFRKVFGVHPDEFELPGVTLDLETYFKSGHSAKDSDTQ